MAVDGGDPANTGSTLVVVQLEDVDDNRAVFTERTYQFSVPENSAVGALVGTVTAVDDDLAPFNAVYYHLLQDSSHGFNIDPHNG